MRVDIKTFLKGIVIGVANIIPGVSGGTMALVMGIYERLIGAINNISITTVKSILLLIKPNSENIANFKKEMEKIDLLFLIHIGTGAALALVSLAKLMTYLLKSQHDATYGFFFGLVLFSVSAPYKMIKKKTFICFVGFAIALSSIIFMTTSTDDSVLINKAEMKQAIKAEAKNDTQAANSDISRPHLLMATLMGAIAISAMILPGISGSFLLLLMGAYFPLLKAISNFDIIYLGFFGTGVVLGILLFSRLLNYLLKKAHDLTLSALTGLVIGSLWVIWPFKNTAVVADKIIYLSNKMPPAITSSEIKVLLSAILGSVIVLMMLRTENKQSEVKS